MTNEHILIHFLHKLVYLNDPQNVIGATTNTTVRSDPGGNDTNTKWVRKYGDPNHIVSDINLSNGVIINPRSTSTTHTWWYEVFGKDSLDGWVKMGTLKDENGSSTYVNGASLGNELTDVRIDIVRQTGTVAIQESDTLVLTLNSGTITVILEAQSFSSGTFSLYMAKYGETYYDIDLKIGGKRHSPDGTIAKPYRQVMGAYAGLGGAFVRVGIRDSEVYEEDFLFDTASSFVVCILGQAATLKNTIGPGTTLMSHRANGHPHHNSVTVYYNESGDDSTGSGTYQEPWATPIYSVTNRGGKNVVFGGEGATLEERFFITAIITVDNYVFEADEGYYTELIESGNYQINVKNNGVLAGLKVNGGSITGKGIVMETAKLLNCEIYGNTGGAIFDAAVFSNFNGTTEIYRNIIHDNETRGIGVYNDAANLKVKYNEIYNNWLNISLTNVVAADVTMTGKIENNILRDSILSVAADKGAGIWVEQRSAPYDFNYQINVDNNLIIDNYYGFNVENSATGVDVIQGTYYPRNNIVMNNEIGLRLDEQTTWTWDYTNLYGNDTAKDPGTWTIISNNELTVDPLFSNLSARKYGLRVTSPMIKAGHDGDDVGLRFRVVTVKEDTIIVDGFYLDAAETFFRCYHHDPVGLWNDNTARWCTLKNSNGIALYADTAATNINLDIKNCKIFNCQTAISAEGKGLDIFELLIYQIVYHALYLNDITINLNHLVIHETGTALKLNSNATEVSFSMLNCILFENTTGIDSDIPIRPKYCDITDDVTANVFLGVSNISVDPEFIDSENSVFDERNYNIVTVEAGFSVDSECKDAGSDGDDIGAYILTRGISDNSWNDYQFDLNPRKVVYKSIVEGFKGFVNIFGSIYSWANAHKLGFDFTWTAAQAGNKRLRDHIQFFTTLIETYENERKEEETIFRVTPLPSQNIFNGHIIEYINIDTKIIRDDPGSDPPHVFDAIKGWNLSIRVLTSSSANVDAVNHKITISGAGWEINEHVGREVLLSTHWFVVLSNTATELIVGDFYQLLEDFSGPGKSIIIYEHFEVLKNTEYNITVSDLDDRLISQFQGKYFDIIFFEAKTKRSGFKYSQLRYFFQQETWKNGFAWSVEQK